MFRAPLLPLSWLLLAGAVSAQVPEVRLARAEARYPKELSSVTGLLELPDGRVLVSDGIDQTLLRIDLRSGKTDTVSRMGAGPGEYKGPDLLFGTPGGGVLLLDLGNARLSFFDAALKYLESSPVTRGNPATGLTMVIPDGVDGEGRVYFRSMMRAPDGRADSGAVVRWDRVRNAYDTVAKLKLSEVKVSSSGGANNRNVSMRPVPLSPEDVWSVAADGRVVVVRVTDYHVEWIRPGSPAIRGPVNPWQPVPIRDADKRAWAAELRATGLATQVQSENGRMSVRIGRGLAGAATPAGRPGEIPNLEWPATKPPVRLVRVSPEGDAWVERHLPAGSPRQFDIFGGDGKIKRRVILPAGRELIGFGKGAVYLKETTEDDLVFLERYTVR